MSEFGLATARHWVADKLGDQCLRSMAVPDSVRCRRVRRAVVGLPAQFACGVDQSRNTPAIRGAVRYPVACR